MVLFQEILFLVHVHRFGHRLALTSSATEIEDSWCVFVSALQAFPVFRMRAQSIY